MPNSTQATMALRKLGIAFKLHTYVYDSNAESIGLQAAEALGVDPNRMLKTLMAEVDGKPVCAVVPYMPEAEPAATGLTVESTAPAAAGLRSSPLRVARAPIALMVAMLDTNPEARPASGRPKRAPTMRTAM